MNSQFTAQNFREQKKKEFEIIKDWVDINYETIWKLTEEAQNISDCKPFLVETAFGSVMFNPNINKLLS